MPLVEKTMTEAELREQIARLKRLAAANPAMARDFGQRAADAQKLLNALLVDQGGYSVTKDADVAAAISAARAEGYQAGYETATKDAATAAAAEAELAASVAAPTYEEFNAREKHEPEVVRPEHQDGAGSGEAPGAGGGDSVRGEAPRES